MCRRWTKHSAHIHVQFQREVLLALVIPTRHVVCRVPKHRPAERHLLTPPLTERLIFGPSKPVIKLSLCRNTGKQKKPSIWGRKANCYALLYCSTVFRKCFEHFGAINKRSRTNRLPCTFIMKREIISRSHTPGGWTHQISAWHNEISAVDCTRTTLWLPAVSGRSAFCKESVSGKRVPHLSRNYTV